MSTGATTVILVKGSDEESISGLKQRLQDILGYEETGDTWRSEIVEKIAEHKSKDSTLDEEDSAVFVGKHIEMEFLEQVDTYLICGISSEDTHMLELIIYLLQISNSDLEAIILFDTDYSDEINVEILKCYNGSLVEDTYMSIDYSYFYGEPNKFETLIGVTRNYLDFMRDLPERLKCIFNTQYLFLDIG